MKNSKLICVILGLTIATVAADVSELPQVRQSAAPIANGLGENPVTDICLGCICEAISNCNRTLTCAGDVCGLFRITWGYWSDGGKPTNGGESVESQTAYPNCVNEPFCAARAVQGYMRKFGQDCNGDGLINCYDFASIHKFGGYGCNQPLPDWYKQKFDACLHTAQQYSSG